LPIFDGLSRSDHSNQSTSWITIERITGSPQAIDLRQTAARALE
jgi:hypothetical protein